MKDELEKYQLSVKMSRETDENDPLDEEIREANAFAPDVAVEVHTNIGGGSGFEVYRQTSTGFGEQSLRLAEEISVMLGSPMHLCAVLQSALS